MWNIILAGGMPYYVLAGISLVIIFSYLFDALARKTKFPSIILLIGLGMALRAVADWYEYEVPYLQDIIPVLGNLGLILIVLEGALELEITRKKLPLILKSLLAALVVLVLCTFALGTMFHFWLDLNWHLSMLVAVPLSIISSAVAIPSAAALVDEDKEFVVYESTFSDILGIVLFTFISAQIQTETPFSLNAFGGLFLELFFVILASIVVTFLLLELIERISHKVKFFLILSILILAYVIAKQFGLSALIIIFFFGLFLSNANVLLPKFLQRFVSTKKAEEDLHEFHILAAETTFFIRTFFFLFFGFSIVLAMFTEINNYIYGFAILAIIVATRFLYFFIAERKKMIPMAFISPRGLISILLFLQVTALATSGGLPDDAMSEELQRIVVENVNEKVLLVVILGSMFVMLAGTLRGKTSAKALTEVFSLDSHEDEEDESETNTSDGDHSDYLPR